MATKEKIRQLAYKQRLKKRIKESNERELNRLAPDPWVVEYRIKNNATKKKWKAKQPKKETKSRRLFINAFRKGVAPVNKLSPEEKQKSIERDRERSRNWHKQNKERVNKYRRERRKNDIAFKLCCNLRKRLSFLLRKKITSKTVQTMKLLGCTMEEFMKHLQGKFVDKMTFSNYGEWHIDHIKPCDSFDLSEPEQQKICFHYTNMQPLWALDNRRKSNQMSI